jgi:hypothetical protein
MIDNDEGYPTGADDKGYFAISHVLGCPNCGNYNTDAIWDSVVDESWERTITERVCLVCECKWYEHDFNHFDEEEE